MKGQGARAALRRRGSSCALVCWAPIVQGGRTLAALLAAGICEPARVAVAQGVDDLRDRARELVRGSGLGDQLVGLSGFAALPGISAATFKVDPGDGPDTDIDRLILPLSPQFRGPRLLGGAPYVEATLGYSRVEQSARIGDGSPGETRLDQSLTTLSALGGLGLGFEPVKGITLRPLGLLGYAHTDDDADLDGPGASAHEPVLDGILLNFTADELLYGGAIEIEHERTVGGLELTISARYNHLWGTTLDASDEALEGDTDFGIFTAATSLPISALGRELRWIAFVTHSRFPGLSGDALGFDYFFELGGGLELVDRGIVTGIEGVSLRASYILGDNVTGFSVGAQLEF